jgi:hypothetical protein
VLVQNKKDRFNYFHTTELKDKPAAGPQFHRLSARHDIFGKNLKLTVRERTKDSADAPWPEEQYYPFHAERGVFLLSLLRHKELAQVTLGVSDFFPTLTLSDLKLMRCAAR